MKKKPVEAHLPRRLKVGFVEYLVDPVSKKFAESKGYMGESDFSKHIMSFDGSLSGPSRVNTVLHETLHLVVMGFGLNDLTPDMEERIVDGIANGLSTVFVDNPALLPWMIEELAKKD